MTHTTAPISAMRQRMIDDMRLRKLSAKTQAAYIRAVVDFTRYFGSSPARASAEDLRRYQLHLVERGTASGNLKRVGVSSRIVTFGRLA